MSANAVTARGQGKRLPAEKDLQTEVMTVHTNEDKPEAGGYAAPAEPDAAEEKGASRRAGAVKPERKRRKVSLIGAVVINVVTLITLAIMLLAFLLPGYRRSFTVARAIGGSQEVLILVRTSEEMMRRNSTDFIRAQDGLRNVLQEEVKGDGRVWAYVRDAYPDLGWVKDNLPEGMQKWLRELYPKPGVSQGNIPEKDEAGGERQPDAEGRT